MSTCKECLHVEVCEKRNRYHADVDEFTGRVFTDMDKSCEYFKDRSKFIESPVEIGKEVYIGVLWRDPKTKILKFGHFIKETVVGVHICDDTLRTNAITNKRYRDYIITKTNGIEELRHISVSKIGKTVFLTKEEAKQALKNQN